MAKKRILSASTPSGDLTLGNYIGAISNWAKMQEEYDSYYMVADLHSLTTRRDPKELRERSYSFLAQYVALGLDPEKTTLFMQSQVPQHAELAWVLNCMTPFGYLNRMTQFKDKSKDLKEIHAGLFNYPSLMAADILLYQANLVPVGEDQKQHLELTRDLAETFNKRYGECFVIPEPYIPKQKEGGRVMSLQDPNRKMSKSDPDEKSRVSIIDSPKKIQKKIKSAVTDSGEHIEYSEDKPGISNLLTIYSSLSGESIDSIVSQFEGKLYGHLKVALADLVCEVLKPVQEKYENLMSDKRQLDEILQTGAEKASNVAEETKRKAYELLGLVLL